MSVKAVHLMVPTTDLTYPQVLVDHPRNAHIDWKAVGIYAESGNGGNGKWDIFVKADREIDAVWIPGLPPIISGRLRAVLEPLAGAPACYLPVMVNARPFWILRVTNVIEALDMEKSQIRYSRRKPGAINAIEIPIWRSDRILDPCLFRVPQEPKSIWATPAVVAAYENSRCNGLTFYPRGEVC